MLIGRKPTIVEGIEYAQRVIDGSCSILILIDNKIYAARRPLRPHSGDSRGEARRFRGHNGDHRFPEPRL